MLQRAATLLLLAWSCLGLLHTGYVMIRPAGLLIRRPPLLAGAIGIPSPTDGPTVTAILELLDQASPSSEGLALIFVPLGLERAARDYIHFQVAHLAYPLRVDLVEPGAVSPLPPESYAMVIAPRGVSVDPRWSPHAEHYDLVLYLPDPPTGFSRLRDSP